MKNILFILEGDEEETLFEIIKEKGVGDKFSIDWINACGFGNVAFLYQDYISNAMYDGVFCVYDVDDRINEENSPYNSVRKQLKQILGTEEAVDAASICTNPNIIQYFLLGADKYENVRLKFTAKSINSSILHGYWDEIGKNKPYRANKWQLDIIKFSYLNEEYKYTDMIENAKQMSEEYKIDKPASNLTSFMDALINNDEKYFDKKISKQSR